jgi:hypothetical protein
LPLVRVWVAALIEKLALQPGHRVSVKDDQLIVAAPLAKDVGEMMGQNH